jgi:SAM-dependent methyltransferase
MSAKTANKGSHQTMAGKADIHELYEESVQNVEHEVEFLRETFQQRTGRVAYTLREDFCGTASLACEWVRQGPEYSAVGVDIEPSVLDWGRQNRISRLQTEEQARVRLIESDVQTVDTPQVDILVAFNFSYWIFNERAQMLNYLQGCHEAVKDDGLMFLDIFGGPESQEEIKEKTKHDDFTYIWHQAEFHPVSNYMKCHIHFKFKDGSRIKKAFTYEWRLWSAPEIRDLLLEAGFSNVTVYWEGEDEDGEGNGIFTPDECGEADLAWVAYIVAEK